MIAPKTLEIDPCLLAALALMPGFVCCCEYSRAHGHAYHHVHYLLCFDGVACDVREDDAFVYLGDERFKTISWVPGGFHLNLILAVIGLVGCCISRGEPGEKTDVGTVRGHDSCRALVCVYDVCIDETEESALECRIHVETIVVSHEGIFPFLF